MGKVPSNFYRPAARWPFRVLALIFLCCAMLACYVMARDALSGEFAGPWGAFGDVGTALASAIMTIVFAWVAFTGRVPDWLWRLFGASVGGEVPQHPDDKPSEVGTGDQHDVPPHIDDGRAPHARWPFRVAALLFVIAAAFGAFSQLRAWVRGAWSPGWASIEDAGLLAMMVVMVWMFGAVALTGRVPRLAWQWFRRTSRW